MAMWEPPVLQVRVECLQPLVAMQKPAVMQVQAEFLQPLVPLWHAWPV
jgi:hypothetical protein